MGCEMLTSGHSRADAKAVMTQPQQWVSTMGLTIMNQ